MFLLIYRAFCNFLIWLNFRDTAPLTFKMYSPACRCVAAVYYFHTRPKGNLGDRAFVASAPKNWNG